eukprot:TRINITY_DN131_c0_g1_i6.p1 TRINITY_DN131_c0_g1~~TRINITY_DN131_c0_g1_i6.p1  ORF type:complete len:100 (-),score=4.93 TRINITY_DN131_c0_g1_i6:376-675(-)
MSLVSLDEQWLLEEIEVLLDTRLTPQWLEGYEPDPTKSLKITVKIRINREKIVIKNVLLGKDPPIDGANKSFQFLAISCQKKPQRGARLSAVACFILSI